MLSTAPSGVGSLSKKTPAGVCGCDGLHISAQRADPQFQPLFRARTQNGDEERRAEEDRLGYLAAPDVRSCACVGTVLGADERMLGTGELPGGEAGSSIEVRTPLRLRWSLARRCASYPVITTHGAAIPLPVILNVPALPTLHEAAATVHSCGTRVRRRRGA